MQNRRFQDFAMFLSGIRDPQKMAMQMLQNNTQSEFAQNLLKVAQTHDEKALGNHYCTITDAMEESKNRSGYSQMDPATFMSRQDMRSYNSYPNHMRPFDPMYGEETKMYYGGRESPTTDWRDNRRGYDQNNMNRTGRYYDDHMEDYRDGRSHISRRGYMEAKDTGMDAESKMRRLKKYLGDLGFDIGEMIADGTSEEKSAIREKLNNIQQML